MIIMRVGESYIEDWIWNRVQRGKYTFSRQELVVQFSHLSEQTIKNELKLLIKKGNIFPVFKGFYSVIPLGWAVTKMQRCKKIFVSFFSLSWQKNNRTDALKGQNQ